MSLNLFSWAFVFSATVVVSLCFLFVLLLIPFLAAVVAGVSSPSDALYFKISVEAIPVGNRQLVLVDVSPPPTEALSRVALGRLSHSAMYGSPGAISAVIEAIENFDRARSMANSVHRGSGAS